MDNEKLLTQRCAPGCKRKTHLDMPLPKTSNQTSRQISFISKGTLPFLFKWKRSVEFWKRTISSGMLREEFTVRSATNKQEEVEWKEGWDREKMRARRGITEKKEEKKCWGSGRRVAG
ncbi:hypothetical protein JZ751_026451 [Albula glossodonta]|uniref:Uncharacterized protein n=1 Tax=Albula glossodonta TaxID=121402 RepID=A0A8T2PKN7_9TELE|nr:hypothetical protein JZ751_026451 [Albula glossodonta]